MEMQFTYLLYKHFVSKYSLSSMENNLQFAINCVQVLVYATYCSKINKRDLCTFVSSILNEFGNFWIF